MSDDRRIDVSPGTQDDFVQPSPEPPRSLRALADATRHQEDADWAFAAIPVTDDEDDWDKAPPPGSDFIAPNIMPPANAIAYAALKAALTPDLRARLAGDDPMVLVVSVPGPDWVDDIQIAANPFVSAGRSIGRDGSSRREHVPSKGNLDVGAWLASGRHVVGISQAPTTFLPSALISAADATIHVRAPDAMTFARILALTGRAPPSDIPDSLCAGMTFAEILSGFRKGLDGRGVVDALKRVSARKAATDVDDGVPPLPDLPGHSGEARAWGTALIAQFAEWRGGTRAWRDVSASAILSGPPGTGKTLYARSLAKALGVPLIATGVGDWFARTEGNLGDVAAAFQAAWDRAMAARPCVFLLDELDAIPNREGMTARGREWWTPIVTLILTATDGAQTARDGLVLIGATNHADKLDAALTRRGRFDRLLPVDLPSADDLAAIMAHHLAGALSQVDLLPVARLARGASAADAAAWAREARSVALSASRAVCVADVAAVLAPPDPRSPDTLRRCAVHEAGHAVASLRLGRGVQSVTLVAAGTSHARTTVGFGPDIPTLIDVDADVLVSLAGRASEEALLGSTSVGAESDLANATAIVAAAHASAGLGGSLVHRASSPDAISLVNVDPDLRDLVGAHLASVYAEAIRLVEANRGAVERIAAALVARRFLTGAEVEALADDRVGAAP